MELQLKDLVIKALKDLGIDKQDAHIETPADNSHGDYATNIALTLTKELGKSAREIAEAIVQKIPQNDVISKVEIAGPGFINFYIAQTNLIQVLTDVLNAGENYGTNDDLKSEDIVIEFTDPNPFKVFHIGHVYTNSAGESISRIFEANGATVHRVNYQGDVGLHAAKALWGTLQLMTEDGITLKDLESRPLDARIQYLGKGYALGNNAYKDEESAKEQMIEINTRSYVSAQKGWQQNPKTKTDNLLDYTSLIKTNHYKQEDIDEIFSIGRAWSLEYFETIYSLLGMTKSTKQSRFYPEGKYFDEYYLESYVADIGAELVKAKAKEGIFIEDNGAVVYKGEKHGLHTRVFINSLGLPTYEAKELGLAPTKKEDFDYTRSIIITGNDIQEYFKVLIQALKETNPALGEITQHLPHGMVRLPEGKMSSRTGDVIPGKDLVEKTQENVLEKIKNNAKTKTDSVKLSEKEANDTANKIALGAIKYAFLKHTIGSNIVFNRDESLNFEGDTGPYIQYAYVRANNIVNKVGKIESEFNKSIQLNQEEAELLKSLSKYPKVIKDAATDMAPSHITTYIFDLAQKFNGFYNKHQVLNEDDEDRKSFRLALTKATAQTLKDGLYLLGIETPAKM